MMAGNLFHVDIAWHENRTELALDVARRCCNTTPCPLVFDITGLMPKSEAIIINKFYAVVCKQISYLHMSFCSRETTHLAHKAYHCMC
jgi:hypothetical protein